MSFHLSNHKINMSSALSHLHSLSQNYNLNLYHKLKTSTLQSWRCIGPAWRGQRLFCQDLPSSTALSIVSSIGSSAGTRVPSAAVWAGGAAGGSGRPSISLVVFGSEQGTSPASTFFHSNGIPEALALASTMVVSSSLSGSQFKSNCCPPLPLLSPTSISIPFRSKISIPVPVPPTVAAAAIPLLRVESDFWAISAS
ncbi:hypothetical protein Hanom_Chr08g00751281 [Helianthus anomalus]